jgi:ABC-type Mn2+/Zn2+ transport system ATPase subunit
MKHDRPLLAFFDTSLGYGGVPVLQHLSFHICRGEFLGIVGPNGSGKTTILRAILGLVKPLHGTIQRSATPVIGYVPQREHIDTIMPVTAFEVALMGRAGRLSAFGRESRRDREVARQALARVGVAHLESRLFRDLSGGQQQRVLIARALAAEPELLVLDEPTTGMDLASEYRIVELIRNLNRESGLTVILVTHVLPVVLNAATTILLLENGRILSGDLADVLEEQTLSSLYRLPVRLLQVGGRRTLVVGAADA